jgi:ribose transport system permease protein
VNAVLSLWRFVAGYSYSLVAYAVVAILWIGASLLIAGFGAYAHPRYIVEFAAVIGLVGIGQTVAVIGGGIDLSVSAIITVTAIILPLVLSTPTRPASARSRWRSLSRPESAP